MLGGSRHIWRHSSGNRDQATSLMRNSTPIVLRRIDLWHCKIKFMVFLQQRLKMSIDSPGGQQMILLKVIEIWLGLNVGYVAIHSAGYFLASRKYQRRNFPRLVE
jgi:hypothetical protein